MKDIELYRLCQRFIEGDEKAFNEIYEDTKGKIFANIYSYVKSKEASEDILSDTYIRFINSIKDLTPDKSILGYLYTISRNLSLNYIEKNKRFNQRQIHQPRYAKTIYQTVGTNFAG